MLSPKWPKINHIEAGIVPCKTQFLARIALILPVHVKRIGRKDLVVVIKHTGNSKVGLRLEVIEFSTG